MCLRVSYKKKIWRKKLFFCILSHWRYPDLLFRGTDPRIRRSAPKCHWSPTLLNPGLLPGMTLALAVRRSGHAARSHLISFYSLHCSRIREKNLIHQLAWKSSVAIPFQDFPTIFAKQNWAAERKNRPLGALTAILAAFEQNNKTSV